MTTPDDPTSHEPRDPAVVERLRATIETLHQVIADRTILAHLSAEDRRKLTIAAGEVFAPDGAERRRLVKAKMRMRRAGLTNRDESVLHQTGIRALRRQPVFTTPNLPVPGDFKPEDVTADPATVQSLAEQNCYVCKRNYTAVHHFYDQLCPACAEFNFAKRNGTRRPARARGAAHGRPREDRLPGRAQAAALRART